jgi:hypothetical protein
MYVHAQWYFLGTKIMSTLLSLKNLVSGCYVGVQLHYVAYHLFYTLGRVEFTLNYVIF